jgi:NAD(P)-dependent dehydrogenase (short-subunit alcohol dehydrogenase family)
MAKTILVTGANRGIGLEICRQLAELGHTVLLTARDKAKGEVAARSLEGDVYAFELDVTKDESVNSCAGNVSAQFDRLDVLINNAAIYKLPGTRAAPLRSATAEEVMTIMNTNFFGPLRMNAAFLPLLRKSPEGRVINISSGMGAWDDLRWGGHAGYRMSKVGLNALTVQLAAELGDTPIKVNAMCPGWVRTDMGGAGASRSVKKGAETAVWLATAEKIPTGKFWRDQREIEW